MKDSKSRANPIPKRLKKNTNVFHKGIMRIDAGSDSEKANARLYIIKKAEPNKPGLETVQIFF